MYMGRNISKKAKLVQMLPFLNILIYFISIECYYYFQSSSLRYTCFQIETCMVFLLFLYLNMKYLARSKIKLIETDLSFLSRLIVNISTS